MKRTRKVTQVYYTCDICGVECDSPRKERKYHGCRDHATVTDMANNIIEYHHIDEAAELLISRYKEVSTK